MFKKVEYIILILNIVLLNKSYSQTFNRNIDWIRYNKVLPENQLAQNYPNRYLFFEKAIYPDPKSMIPVYFEAIPIAYSSVSINDLEINISDKVYSTIDSMDYRSIKDKGEVNKFQQEFKLYKSQGSSVLTVSIPALKLITNDSILKLTSFRISITPKKELESSVSQKISTYKSSSVLAEGKWVKIKVDRSGVYKITYSELNSYGLSNLSNISVWGSGGKKLSYLNSQPSPDDLDQIPVFVQLGGDGIFNQDDYILFYAEGPLTWSYDSTKDIYLHELHPYTKKICYFLTTDVPSPKRIAALGSNQLIDNHSSSYHDVLEVFENNDTNLVKSGREWFGDNFDIYTIRNYSIQINDPEPASKLKIRVRACARSSQSSNYSVGVNDNFIGVLPLFPVNIGDEESDFVSVALRDFNADAPSGNVDIKLTYSKPNLSSMGWLDYISVNSRQKNVYKNNQLIIRDKNSVGESNITRFSIETDVSDLKVWEISDLFNPQQIVYNKNGSLVDFMLATDTLKTIIAFEPDKCYKVDFDEKVVNQNLHGLEIPEMLIITHPLFIDQANKLADLHREKDGLSVEVVDIKLIYNEFSSGHQDVTAIRNFIRMLYKRSISESGNFRYVLLFGDGSYDNISEKKQNSNFIPTYQSQNSISKVQSFVTDDFFGLLDDNEGEADGLIDVGVGRLPVGTIEQAENVVSKIEQYLSESSIGDWNQQLCFIGDDEDGNLHMNDANILADYVRQNHPSYNVQKVFFDAFLQQSTSQGERYPDVTSAINDRVNNGALIINYTGHGNEQWLAHEKVLMLNDVQSWRNFQRLPLFVTATCEFSRFDDYNTISTGEWVLLTPRGGGIGLLSTTRLVYSSGNFALNYSFISTVFDQQLKHAKSSNTQNEEFYRLGDIVRITKNNSGGGYNKRNFMLLGDPALMLKYPSRKLIITRLNDTQLDQPVDTLKALSLVRLAGEIQTFDGSADVDYNGVATLSLFDKEKNIVTLQNNGGQPMEFKTQDNLIYKGSVSIVNGQFTIDFMLPKDINYRYGKGRISLFAKNDTEFALGYNEDIIVGGVNQNPLTDNLGPEIEVFMNDERFVSGGITDPNPRILVKVYDNSGINLTGNGIGHDLTANLSGAMDKTIVLNNFYSADVDSYTSGTAEFQLASLEKGIYTLNLKAWDIYNNSSESKIRFKVIGGDDLQILNLLNFPNPLSDRTSIYFEHNQTGVDFTVLVRIFNLSGQLMKTIRYSEASTSGYRIGPIEWDGKGDFGNNLPNGIYLYNIKVTTSNGGSAERTQKLVILK